MRHPYIFGKKDIEEKLDSIEEKIQKLQAEELISRPGENIEEKLERIQSEKDKIFKDILEAFKLIRL